MTILLISAILINLAISALVANSAKSREVSQSKIFWVSFLLTPILGMFIALMSRQLSPEEIKEKEKIPKRKSENPVFIAGVLLSVILLSLVSFKVYSLYQEKIEEQEKKESAERFETEMNERVSKFKSEGRDTTLEFKAYFADRYALLSKEKEDLLRFNKLPESYNEAKEEMIRSMCTDDLMNELRHKKLER
jgi:hypothetical protein